MKVMLLVTLAVVVALCQVPWTAHAQEGVSPEAAATLTAARDAEVPPDLGTNTRGWFGWQTLTADLGSLGLIVLGGANDAEVPIALGVIGYLVVTPIVFAGHDDDWWLNSLALRLSAPALMFTGALIAFSGCPLFDESSSCDGRAPGLVIMGGGVLLAAAMPIVDAVLAVNRRPSRAERAGVAITPWLTPHADAAGLALSGRL